MRVCKLRRKEAKGPERLSILLGVWYLGILGRQIMAGDFHNVTFCVCMHAGTGVAPSSILCLAGDLFSDLLPVKLISLY
jgi:hypothetical protein